MTVYVDDLQPGRVQGCRASQWCHLIADTVDELHDVARRIGLRPEWFQGDHYDLTSSKRSAAIMLGAVPVSRRQLVRIRNALRALRHPDQRCEHCGAVLAQPRGEPGPCPACRASNEAATAGTLPLPGVS